MDRDTERVSVQTYVPRYQRKIWSEEAEERGMSRAEYVRTMVQAGRRWQGDTHNGGEPAEPGVDPGGDTLQERIIDVLDREGSLGWDALFEHVFQDQERALEQALDRLQQDNRIRYSGPNGGYEVVENGE